jgi:hypothetical protein
MYMQRAAFRCADCPSSATFSNVLLSNALSLVHGHQRSRHGSDKPLYAVLVSNAKAAAALSLAMLTFECIAPRAAAAEKRNFRLPVIQSLLCQPACFGIALQQA